MLAENFRNFFDISENRIYENERDKSWTEMKRFSSVLEFEDELEDQPEGYEEAREPGRFVRPPGYFENRPSFSRSRFVDTVNSTAMAFDGQHGMRPGSIKFPKMQEKDNAKERQREWKEYRSLLEAFYRLSPHIGEDREKMDMLKLGGGTCIRDALKDFRETEDWSFEMVLQFLDKKFDAGITAQGYLVEFWNAKQKSGEGFIDFVRRLEELARDANMGADKDQSIILQSLKGAKNSKRLYDPIVYYGKTLEEIKHLATQLEIEDAKNTVETKNGVKAAFNTEDETQKSLTVNYLDRGATTRRYTNNYARGYPPNRRYHLNRGRNRFQTNDNRQPTNTNDNRQPTNRPSGTYRKTFDDRKPIQCYQCEKFGHIARDCRAVFRVEKQEENVQENDQVNELMQ